MSCLSLDRRSVRSTPSSFRVVVPRRAGRNFRRLALTAHACRISVFVRSNILRSMSLVSFIFLDMWRTVADGGQLARILCRLTNENWPRNGLFLAYRRWRTLKIFERTYNRKIQQLNAHSHLRSVCCKTRVKDASTNKKTNHLSSYQCRQPTFSTTKANQYQTKWNNK